MLAGLSRPTTGRALIAGHEPADNAEFLREIGYLAQEVPLYRRWNAADHLALGAHMNPSWDAELTVDRLRSLRIPLDRPMESLSGGMRAQVALALALGKRPQLLLLDEPVAALDPLARHEFLASLAVAVADGGVTVLMSSHLLPDLERVCDHLVLIADAAARHLRRHRAPARHAQAPHRGSARYLGHRARASRASRRRARRAK